MVLDGADYDVDKIFAKKCLCHKLQTWNAALFAQSATTFLIPVFLLPTWSRKMRRKSTAAIIAELFALFCSRSGAHCLLEEHSS